MMASKPGNAFSALASCFSRNTRAGSPSGYVAISAFRLAMNCVTVARCSRASSATGTDAQPMTVRQTMRAAVVRMVDLLGDAQDQVFGAARVAVDERVVLEVRAAGV